MRARRSGPDLPPGGARVVAGLALLAAAKGAGLLMVGGGIAEAIAAIAAGTTAWQAATVLTIAGVLTRAGATWASSVLAARGAIDAKTVLRRQVAQQLVSDGSSDGSRAVLATEGLDGLDEYYTAVIPSAVQAAVVPLVLLVRIVTADWLSAAVVALTIPLVPVFMILIGMYSRQRTAAASAALDRLSDHLAELARGLPVLVGLGRIAEQTEGLRRIQSAYRERTRQTLRIAFLSALALELIATLSVAVVAVLLGVRLLSGELPLETALLVLLLAPDCFSALRDVGTAFHSAQNGRTALEKVRALPRAVLTAMRVSPGPARVDGLRVRYPGRRADAIGRLTATFEPGSVTAVLGASGSGKSTLVAALTGTLPLDASVSGEISGIDPARIGYCPQAPKTFASTVRAEVELYAEHRAQALGILGELGLEHLADTAPAELSPGELRRVAVARALLRADAGARLLVLDEPTAHLDDRSARLVREAIQRHRGSAAVVLVSHDPATRALADRNIRLDAGGSRTEQRTQLSSSVEPVPAARPALTRESRSGRAGTLTLLASLLRPDARRWVASLAWGVVAACLGLSLTAVSAWLIVRAGAQVPIMYLMVAIVGVRFFGLGRSAARYVERVITHGAVLHLVDGLRLRLWDAVARRGAASRALAEGGSALDYLVTRAADVREALPRITPVVVGATACAAVAVAVALIAAPLAPLVAIAVGATLAATVTIALAREWRHGPARTAIRSRLVRQCLALGTASADLRGNGVAGIAVDRFVSTDATRAQLERSASWTSGLTGALAWVGVGIVAALLPSAAVAHGVSAELTAVAVLLLVACAEQIAAAAAAAQRLPGLMATLADLAQLLRSAEPVGPGQTVLTGPVRRLELDSLSARWPDTRRDVFSDVSGGVTAPRWLAVHGPSGSGKSTLLTVLLRALPPSGGAVMADGVDLAAVATGDWSTRIAWCPQEAHVFDSTLRANLLIARPRTEPVTDADMRDVLTRVGLGALLERVEAGLDALVGPGGSALSGGERQRLAVARALLKDADILLLDEPTAHLDEESADAMMDDIRRATGDRIVVLVSHRDADHRPEDAVVELLRPSDRVVERGDPDGRGINVGVASSTASTAG